MRIDAVVEYNAGGYLVYAGNYPGAFVRGAALPEALAKLDAEMRRYLRWRGESAGPSPVCVRIVQEKESALTIAHADSDVLFASETPALPEAEYVHLKTLAMKSARDFQALYDSVLEKDHALLAPRKTFYGEVPHTARAMYAHTKNVNAYYFGEIGVEAGNEPDIHACRAQGFERLEAMPGFLENSVFDGSYGEQWTLRKVCRRFIWHDRIHAKAMHRAAMKLWGAEGIANPFFFAP